MDLTVPNALSDIQLQCRGGVLYVSRMLLAYHFPYFHTMFTSDVPNTASETNCTTVNFYATTILILLRDKTPDLQKINPMLTLKRTVDIVKAMDFLGLQQKVRLPAHSLAEIMPKLYPNYIHVIDADAWHSYINSSELDVKLVEYHDIINYINHLKLIQINKKYIESGMSLESMTDGTLKVYKRYSFHIVKKMFPDLVKQFLDLPADAFREFVATLSSHHEN